MLYTLFGRLNILLCFLNAFSSDFIKSIFTFMCDFINSGFRLIGSIFFRSILICIYRMFCFVLCGDICLFHLLTGNGSFIQGLYRAFDRISCFNISHIKPPSPQKESNLVSLQDCQFVFYSIFNNQKQPCCITLK